MDTTFTTDFGRQVRVTASKTETFIQIETYGSDSLKISAVMNHAELDKLIDALTEAKNHHEAASPKVDHFTDQQRAAIWLLGLLTRGTFDIWQLSGNSNAANRARVMTTLTGQRTPQSKSGVTAMTEAFYAFTSPAGTCPAERESHFMDICKAVHYEP